MPPTPDERPTAERPTADDVRPRRPHRKAIGPRLRPVLVILLVLVAVLGANSAYLAGVTFLEWTGGVSYQTPFYMLMFLGHLVLGLLIVVPFVGFAVPHILNTRHRRNRRAVRVGWALFAVAITILVSGLLLVRLDGFALNHPTGRGIAYWAHVVTPLAALWLYWLHRLTGPKLNYRLGVAYVGVVGIALALMLTLHTQDPRSWNVAGPESPEYFAHTLARTADGNYIPAAALTNDAYCKECHPDVHGRWEDSVHHFSSFNNPAYLASVRETRKVALERDGDVTASRFCAGCHDPVPLFSGAFDDPAYDDVADPTSQAGITCTVCHAITHVPEAGPRGNADYTIEQPQPYPFQYADSGLLRWLNRQLVKAKPTLHKESMLKPLHKTPEFCATCHKVFLPGSLTKYKEFLRGQNHYDSYHLSGVSGHGSRSFYYPLHAQDNCNECHMPPTPSDDLGAFVANDGLTKVHDHLFPGANTGIATMLGKPEIAAEQAEFLKGVCRVDLFGVRAGETIDGALTAPLRPSVPTLTPGGTYLLETVIRTLKVGHHFTQGTTDSNEVWLDVTVREGDSETGRVVGRSGGRDGQGEVDPWSHFVNNYILDRHGARIDRRNAQDIMVPLYNHQIPPGAGQVVHYRLHVPGDATGPLTVSVKLRYRKFDATYLRYIRASLTPDDHLMQLSDAELAERFDLPAVVIAEDAVTLPVAGGQSVVDQPTPDIPLWQRWNDYGIGLLLEGNDQGGKGDLRQAEQAFAEVEKLGRYDGPLNLARVHFAEGLLDEATAALQRAASHDDPPAPPWTLAWFSGMVNRQQGNLEAAADNFRSIVGVQTAERLGRGFDFSQDYVAWNELGATLFDLARRLRGDRWTEQRSQRLREAVECFETTLKYDPENVTAHYNLSQLHERLGDAAAARRHRELHARYKPDDNATDAATAIARRNDPAADHAAQQVVVHDLHRPDAYDRN